MVYFRSNIKTIRKKWGLYQDDLADLMEVTKTSISNYEAGKNEPKVSLLFKLQNITGIPAWDLFHRIIKVDEIPSKPLPEAEGLRISQQADSVIDPLQDSEYYNFHHLIQRLKSLEKRVSKLDGID